MTDEDKNEVFVQIMNLLKEENYGVALAGLNPLAEEGHDKSQALLGLLYSEGTGVEKDLSKARYWLQKAVDQGRDEFKESLFKVTFSLYLEHEEAERYDESFTLLKYLAESSTIGPMPLVYKMLARKYKYGKGVAKDLGKARYWLQKAADAGDPEAKMELNELNRSSSGSSSSSSSGGSSSSYDDDSDSDSDSGSYVDQRNGFVSFLFGLVGAVGILGTAFYILAKLNLNFYLNVALYFIVPIAALIITYSAWHNRKNILFIVMLALCVPGYIGLINEIRGKETTQQTEIITATVTADALNFRSGPGTSSDIIKAVTKGDTLIVTGDIENGWVPVTHNGDAGWVSAEMVSISTASSQSAGGTTTVSQTPASFSDLIGTWKRNNYGNTLTFTANTLKSSSQDYTWDFVSASSGSFRIRSEYNSGTNINISLTNGNMIISGDSGSGEDNWNGTWVKQGVAVQTQSAPQQAQTTNSEQSATSSADLSGGIVEWARGRYPDNVVLNANSITNGRDINITGVRTDVQSPLSGHPNLKWAYIYAGDKKYGVVWDRTTYDRSAHNGIELGMGSEARSAFDFYSGSDKDSIFNDIAREAPGIKVVKQ